MSRRLESQHQPRTLRIVGNFDEPQRISRTDEAVITERVRAAEDEAINRTRGDLAGKLARLERELQVELVRLKDPRIRPTRQLHRDFGSAIATIGRVRAALTRP